MKHINRFKRLATTIKYLKWSQIWHRICFMGKRKIAYPFRIVTLEKYQRKISHLTIKENSRCSLLYQPNWKEGWPFVAKAAYHQEVRDIQTYRFTFLNVTRQFDDEPDWHDRSLSHLWRYNLHYFDYAITLGVAWREDPANTSLYETFKSLVLSWIRHNQRLGIGDGWHPYTVSLRLVNWTYAYDLFKSIIDEDIEFKQTFLTSYSIQSLFLRDNLEWDVLGNHLIENGRALVFAGIFLDSPFSDALLQRGLNILWGQLNEQILPDGGHYERSPMYHQIVLKDYLEVIRLLTLCDIPVPRVVREKVKKMLYYQEELLHPDGNIALLNDSAFHIAPSPEAIRLLAVQAGFESRPSSSESFSASDSGYYIYRGPRLFLIADAGAPCPDFLPAHAHADFGTFELSLSGKRWIVDSGVFQYQGEYRNQLRGTAAHNCLMINNRNQSDVWGSFRLAERAKPRTVLHRFEEAVWLLSASHNGYEREGVLPIRKFFIISDHIVVVLDEIKGRNSVAADAFLHLHPDIALKHEGDCFTTSCGQDAIYIQPFGSGDFHAGIVEGRYSPEFGVMKKSKVLAMSSKLELSSTPSVFGFVLSLHRIPLQFRMEPSKEIYDLVMDTTKLSVKIGEQLEYHLEHSEQKEV